jgi:hypothetical protein
MSNDREFFRRVGTAILIVASAMAAYMMVKVDDMIGLFILSIVFAALFCVINIPFFDEHKKGE